MKYLISFLLCLLIVVPTYAAVEAVTLGETTVFRFATNGSASLGRVESGTVVNLISPKNSHYEIEYEGETGWIRRSAVKVTLIDGHVSLDKVNYRSTPHVVDHNILGQLESGTELEIMSIVGEFCEIRYGDAAVYVSRELVSSDKFHLIPSRPAPSNPPPAPTPEPVSELLLSSEGVTGRDITSLAMNYLGGRYVWGGNNLETGVDCSGFVRQLYKKFGIILTGASYDLVRYGVEMPISDLTHGDLLFFRTRGTGIGHVGIYVSNGYFIHAASTKSGIITSKLSDRNDFVVAKRVIAND